MVKRGEGEREEAAAKRARAAPPLSDPLLSLGESFAQKILANEASSAKFGFLKDDDPYHTYYRERVKAAAAGVDLSTTTLAPAAPAANASASDKAKAAAAASKMTVVSSVGAGGGDGGKAEPIAPPPPDAYAVPVPAGLTPHELDALRLTAACVARNGGSFAAGLADREAANPAFAFLRATHSLHPFFTALVAAYARVLAPSSDVLATLRRDADDRAGVLARVLRRLEWEKVTRADAAARDAAATAEREAMASIDWHDFVVVETIAFYEGEEGELPPPKTLAEVVAASKASAAEAAAAGGAPAAKPPPPPPAATGAKPPPPPPAPSSMTAEERAMVVAGAAAVAFDSAPAPPPSTTGAVVTVDDDGAPVRVVKDYVRPGVAAAAAARAADAARVAVSPFTGELVPVDAMAEHMRVALLDPKWRTQRDAMLAKVRVTAKASDEEIVGNLISLAKRRPDVFGEASGDTAVAAAAAFINASINLPPPGPRAGPPAPGALPAPAGPAQPPAGSAYYGRPPPLGWGGGPPPGWGAPQPPPPGAGLPEAPPGVDVLPPGVAPAAPPPGMPFARPPFFPPGARPPFPFVVPLPPPPPPADEPAPKRPRPDAPAPFVLVPADEFAAAHPGPVELTADVAAGAGTAGGTKVTATLDSILATVADLKAALAPAVGLAVNKQKLSTPGAGVLADRHTLAHYNLATGGVVALGLKARGKR